jgi:hypothetical protein
MTGYEATTERPTNSLAVDRISALFATRRV